MTTALDDTQDADPSNMYLRAGYLSGLAESTRPLTEHDRDMLRRAGRSLLLAAREASSAAKEPSGPLPASAVEPASFILGVTGGAPEPSCVICSASTERLWETATPDGGRALVCFESIACVNRRIEQTRRAEYPSWNAHRRDVGLALRTKALRYLNDPDHDDDTGSDRVKALTNLLREVRDETIAAGGG